jgi:hypothetical protein
VVAALGIAAFALVAIVGLLPTSLMSTRDTVQSTEGAQIASAIDCDLRSSAATTGTSGTSSIYNIPLQTGTCCLFLDNLGNKTISATSAQFRAQIVITAAQGAFAANQTIAPVTYAAILLTWPAVPVTNASSHLETASSFTWPH